VSRGAVGREEAEGPGRSCGGAAGGGSSIAVEVVERGVEEGSGFEVEFWGF